MSCPIGGRVIMEAIYPITALSKQQAEVKSAAKDDIVRITEHGAAAWIFASEEAFEARIQKAVTEAVSEAQIAMLIERGRSDVDSGNVVIGTDRARKKLAQKRAK